MDTLVEPAARPVEAAPPIQGRSFLPRAGAYIIDSVILFGISYVSSLGLGYLLGALLYLLSALTGLQYWVGGTDTTCLYYLVGIVEMTAYFTLFEWLYGRTLGKIVLGMRVIGSDGSSCSFKQAFVRALYRLIDGLVFGAVAYSNMRPPGNQRLGDKRMNTLVVSAKDAAIREHPAWWRFWLALGLYLLVDGLLLSLGILANVRF